MFYGIIFDNMPYDAPFAFMNGQVIDMLYFPIFSFNWPEWMPYIGSNRFHFFSAIFNIADSSIFIGVMILLIWQKRFFPESVKPKQESEEASPVLSQDSTGIQLQSAMESTEDVDNN
jgi:signal peptidase II